MSKIVVQVDEFLGLGSSKRSNTNKLTWLNLETRDYSTWFIELAWKVKKGLTIGRLTHQIGWKTQQISLTHYVSHIRGHYRCNLLGEWSKSRMSWFTGLGQVYCKATRFLTKISWSKRTTDQKFKYRSGMYIWHKYMTYPYNWWPLLST